MEDIVKAWRKGSILTNFKNKYPKSTACLPQYIDIVHAVRQELLLIAENFVFLLHIPFQNLSSLIA
jgi:hypothetical protein